MQFIENSIIGLRAAYHRLSAGPESADVCLFPMVHIGAPAYYAEVQRRLDSCDVVLFEGVRSFRVGMLTRAYSIATRSKRMGLVLQGDALDIPSVKQERIHADVSADEFADAWDDVPLYQRALLLFGAPLYGLWMYFAGSRQSIGRKLNTDSLESREDLERSEEAPELEAALGTTRDLRLVEEVSRAVEQNGAGTRIGVIYGAAHMRVVSRLLMHKYGYRVVESEWMTVFSYQ